MTYAFYTGFSEMMRQRGAAEAAKYAASLGFSAVEPIISGTPAKANCPADLREAEEAGKILADSGIRVACYSAGATLWGQNADAVEETLKTHVRCAAAMGSPYFHHTLILSLTMNENLPSYDEALETVLPRALRISQLAESLGVVTLYEPQGMFFNGVDGLGTFYRELRRLTGNVGICGDVGNPLFADADPVEVFRAFAADIRHVHIKDYIRRDDAPADPKGWYITRSGKHWLRDTVIGTGVIDLAGCMDALKSVGYSGAIAFETPPELFADGVKAGMELLKSLGM